MQHISNWAILAKLITLINIAWYYRKLIVQKHTKTDLQLIHLANTYSICYFHTLRLIASEHITMESD